MSVCGSWSERSVHRCLPRLDHVAGWCRRGEQRASFSSAGKGRHGGAGAVAASALGALQHSDQLGFAETMGARSLASPLGWCAVGAARRVGCGGQPSEPGSGEGLLITEWWVLGHEVTGGEM